MPQTFPPRPRRAAKLIEYLEGKIVSGQFPAGHQLAPLRQLQEEFQVSYSSVQRAVAYLCSRGLMEKHGREIRIGLQQSRDERKVFKQIAVFLYSCRMVQSTGLYLSALHGIQQAALEADYALLVSPLDVTAHNYQQKLMEAAERASGVILLLEYDNLNGGYPLQLPTVGVQMTRDFNGRLSLIDIDPLNCAEQAVQYFQQRQCRRLQIITDSRPCYRLRAEAFRLAWSQATGEAPDIRIHHLQQPCEIDFPPESALFFTSDNLAQFFCVAYQQKHPSRHLPQDYPLLSVDGKRLIVPEFEAFPTIAVDWLKVGRTAFEECLAMIRQPGRSRRRILLPGTLHE